MRHGPNFFLLVLWSGGRIREDDRKSNAWTIWDGVWMWPTIHNRCCFVIIKFISPLFYDFLFFYPFLILIIIVFCFGKSNLRGDKCEVLSGRRDVTDWRREFWMNHDGYYDMIWVNKKEEWDLIWFIRKVTWIWVIFCVKLDCVAAIFVVVFLFILHSFPYLRAPLSLDFF